MKTWLLIDAHHLCYSSFFALGKLSYGEDATEVVYGFLSQIIHLQDIFQTDNVAFCFDYGKNLRLLQLPSYKANRRDRTAEEQEAYNDLQDQIKKLRREHLPNIGYRNIFFDKGYEADDVIASICRNNIGKKNEAIIVSGDHDLYQLIRHNVSVYHPNQQRIVDRKAFCDQWGIEPSMWIDVKALAGCKGDNVEGIRGVGEKTAAKFLNGTLNPNNKTFESIVRGNKIWKRNKPIVKLPYAGVSEFEFRKDRVTKKTWNKVVNSLGMRTLRDSFRSYTYR